MRLLTLMLLRTDLDFRLFLLLFLGLVDVDLMIFRICECIVEIVIVDGSFMSGGHYLIVLKYHQ